LDGERLQAPGSLLFFYRISVANLFYFFVLCFFLFCLLLVSLDCLFLIATSFFFSINFLLFISEPALIAKSSILLDVKPWDDETDMAELEKCVRSVATDGLLWGQCKLQKMFH
jgi:Zn-dependent protease with chaperone function